MEITLKEKTKVSSSKEIAGIMQKILSNEDEIDRKKEHFWTVGLNSNNVIKYIELVSLGILNQALVHPRETFRLAVMKAAAQIVVIHNHPSGDFRPSEADRIITGKLTKAGKILDVKVLDHIIIANDLHYSFADNGEI